MSSLPAARELTKESLSRLVDLLRRRTNPEPTRKVAVVRGDGERIDGISEGQLGCCRRSLVECVTGANSRRLSPEVPIVAVEVDQTDILHQVR